MYDYGNKTTNIAKSNTAHCTLLIAHCTLDRYGTDTPPPYKLADMMVKTALFTGELPPLIVLTV